MRAVFDTNVLIDYLSGADAARRELNRFDKPAISMITWMEVMVGGADDSESNRIQMFLSGFQHIDIDWNVSRLAVEIRREHRIRLPDAIIWASARSIGGILVTRNTRDFPADDPGIRVPYRLS